MSEFSLVPHIGKEKKSNGHVIDVDMGQYQIMFGGVRVGYVNKKPNSPICLIRHYPDSFHQEVRAFVAAQNGEPSSIAQPPKPEVIAKYEDGDDEDGDE